MFGNHTVHCVWHNGILGEEGRGGEGGVTLTCFLCLY